MGDRIDSVDAYIADASEILQPVLYRVRDVVHAVCPEVSEAIKWNIPFFEYEGLLLGLAAYTQHVSIAFWKAKLMGDPDAVFTGEAKLIKAGSVDELPGPGILEKYIERAIQLNHRDLAR